MLQLSRLHVVALATAVAFGLSAGTVAAAEKLKVAVLVPGLANDGSFNQVALEGIKKLADEGLVTYELREKQRDPASSEPVIRQYAQRGYDLIIGHGIELSEPILNVSKDFPKVHFAASGGPDLANKLTANTDGWTYDFAQQGYLSGWVAGKMGVNKVGAVGGPQLPSSWRHTRASKPGSPRPIRRPRSLRSSPARSTTCNARPKRPRA